MSVRASAHGAYKRGEGAGVQEQGCRQGCSVTESGPNRWRLGHVW